MAIWKKFILLLLLPQHLDTALHLDHSCADPALECRASWQGYRGIAAPLRGKGCSTLYSRLAGL